MVNFKEMTAKIILMILFGLTLVMYLITIENFFQEKIKKDEVYIKHKMENFYYCDE